MDEIKLITQEEAAVIVANGNDSLQGYEPWGLFYYMTTDRSGNTLFIGVDNSDGNCWIEEFYSIGACMAWLRSENND